ncbi:TIGR02206 family membrane protein [Alkalihalobacillus sp. MEB130]|uniref:YwaF family protein n=1 Tax=Alkalihalobacillus sp. MEB130 TaxID=2976704 RepID=UPI0028DF84FE|nr:TIGR02206 family membrane protein [Alkalihalobacillus sp. MEB130]MDT8859894.1 TIGR02206 family membrane protein [Alkalihalobacillus sp. MEB130]
MPSMFERGAHWDDALFLSPVHIATLVIFIILVILLYRFRKNVHMKSYGRTVLIFLLVLSEISIIFWSVAVGLWDIRFNLPLQLCTISLYLCVGMLLFKHRGIFEIVYFFGLAGALQALITPDLFYTFPHFRYLHFFIAHFAIIFSILYMVWVEQFFVTFSSLVKSFLVLNFIAIIAFFVNQLTGANYMFLARKPQNESILDLLGPYPWYILSLEAIAFLMFTLLYLPFLIKAKKKQ